MRRRKKRDGLKERSGDREGRVAERKRRKENIVRNECEGDDEVKRGLLGMSKTETRKKERREGETESEG